MQGVIGVGLGRWAGRGLMQGVFAGALACFAPGALAAPGEISNAVLAERLEAMRLEAQVERKLLAERIEAIRLEAQAEREQIRLEAQAEREQMRTELGAEVQIVQNAQRDLRVMVMWTIGVYIATLALLVAPIFFFIGLLWRRVTGVEQQVADLVHDVRAIREALQHQGYSVMPPVGGLQGKCSGSTAPKPGSGAETTG